MHTFKVPEHMQAPSNCGSPTLQLDMRIAKTADFYGVRYLKRAAIKSFRRTCDRSSIDQDVVNTITEAYAEDGFDHFREMLVNLAAKHLRALKAEPQKYAYFWAMASACGEFSAALLQLPIEPAPNVTPLQVPKAPTASSRSSLYSNALYSNDLFQNQEFYRVDTSGLKPKRRRVEALPSYNQNDGPRLSRTLSSRGRQN